MPNPATTDLFENPLGLDGFEFIEFSAPEPGLLEPAFSRMGFAHIANHRAKNVQLWRQGGINLIANYEPRSPAAYFAAEHGPSACGMGWRVCDAGKAYAEAIARGAEPHVMHTPRRALASRPRPIHATPASPPPRHLQATVENMPLVVRSQLLMASSSTSNTSNCLALKKVEGPTCVTKWRGQMSANERAAARSAIMPRPHRWAEVGGHDDAAASADAHALHARLEARDHAVDAQPRLRRPPLAHATGP